jgi:D-alanyl-D-alanine carboxypeptidase/D-alanyl-D-alanine-endopeptidase (penicillin-binding protein 4)
VNARFPRLLAPLALAACATLQPAAPAPPAQPVAVPAVSPRAAFAAVADSIFNDTVFAGANWGVIVRSLDSGETLYSRNPRRMFVPASNMKLVTGSAALELLGPDYRYRTALVATGPVVNGDLQGDLLVVGSGDPSIAADFHGGNPYAVFSAWADSLRAHGITHVSGRLLGDDDVFDDQALGRGWAWDDLQDGYSAEVGGLEYNLGINTIAVTPGAVGGPARVARNPDTRYVTLLDSVRTVAAGESEDLEVVRADTGRVITVRGTVPADGAVHTIDAAVRNNTRYFLVVLREVLTHAGISISGGSEDLDDLPAAARPTRRDVLFTHASPPLSEILAGFMKPSQNQIGELLLKTLGRNFRGEGSARAGAAVVDSVHRVWGLAPRRLAQADGSGLSRYNLLAPELLIGILEHMRRSPNYAAFYAALPVAGVDGTLRSRMRGTPLQGNVHAKTGTVTNVRSLSGYLTTAAGEQMEFSMIVNHHTVTSRDADRLAEATLMKLYALPRR